MGDQSINKAIALIDPFSSGSEFKERAKSKGYNVIGVFTVPEECLRESFHGSIEEFSLGCDAVILSENPNKIIEELHSASELVGVMAASESGVEVAEIVADKLKLPCNCPCKSRRNKYEMRKAVQEKGLSSPAFQKCAKVQEAIEFSESHTFPLVVKTPEGGGTKNIFVCSCTEEVIVAFQKVISSPDIYQKTPTYALIEEYIEGPEYIVNLFSDHDKIYVTDVWLYEKGRDPGPENLCWNCSMIPQDEAKEVVEYAKQVVRALNIKIGPSHAEIKLDPVRGPTLIEIGARICGVNLPKILHESCNFDLFDQCLEIFTENKSSFPNEPKVNKFFAISFGLNFNDGVVEAIEGIEKIQTLPSYIQHKLYLEIGQEVHSSKDLTNTPLFVYLGNEDRKQLKKDIEEVHNLFHLKVK